MDCPHEWEYNKAKYGHWWECTHCRRILNNDGINQMLALQAEHWRQAQLAAAQEPHCGNCAHLHGQECHRHAPGPKGWPYVHTHDKCGDFKARGSDDAQTRR